MLSQYFKASPPVERAELHAAIGLGAILFLVLLALGFLCSKRARKKRERDVEQQRSEQEEHAFHDSRVANGGTTDTLDRPALSRADSATSSPRGAEHRVKRGRSRPRETSQQQLATTEQHDDSQRAMEQLRHDQNPEKPLPPLSEATASQGKTLESSLRNGSDIRRQSSTHSIPGRLSVRRPSLSKTRYGRRLCNLMVVAGAERHSSTLAIILESEAALHALSMDECYT